MLSPTEGDTPANRGWRGPLRLLQMVAVIAIGGALAAALAPAGGAGAVGHAAPVARDWLASSELANAKPAACRQSKRTYRYRITYVGSLDYTVTLKPNADGRGNSGVWGFEEDYSGSDKDAKVRVDRMLGNCAGALGFAYLPPPGGKYTSDLGTVGLTFQYHSHVKPVYPPDDPHRDDPPPPPCSYTYAAPLLLADVGGAPLLASWGRGLRFGFSAMMDRDVASSVIQEISKDKLESDCDPYHGSFAPGKVNTENAVVKGVEFRSPAVAGETTALATIVRWDSSKLRFPVNKLVRGKNFELDSGDHVRRDKVSDTKTDRSTWRTHIFFTRVQK